MVYDGPQKYPGANLSYFYQNTYGGTRFEANVVVWHTTEGRTLPSYGGGGSAPNLTAVPDMVRKRLDWYQHFDIDRSSRALRNLSGGVETNTLNSCQVELVGTCDPATRDRWNAQGYAGKFIFWPSAPDWALAEVAKFVSWLHANHSVQIKSTVTWKAYPSSYGNSSVRLSGSQWQNYYGHLGHQHVPENDHGDPGNINFARIIEHALGTGTGTGEEVALTTEDVKKLFETDNVLKAGDNSTTNPYWTAESYFYETYKVSKSAESLAKGARSDVTKARGDIAALAAQVAELKAKVDQLSVSGVDENALADLLADKLAERFAA